MGESKIVTAKFKITKTKCVLALTLCAHITVLAHTLCAYIAMLSLTIDCPV